MAEERTILLKVELDVDQLTKRQKEAAEAVDRLTAKRKELRSAEEKDTIAIAENALELRKANQELKKTTEALATQKQAQEDNTGSLTEMRQQLAAAKVAFAELSQEQRDSDFGQKAAADMLALKEAINEVEQSFGTFTGSVGNYEKANEKLIKTLDEVNKGLAPLDDGVKALEDAMEDLRKEGKENSDEMKALEAAMEELHETEKKLAGDMEHLGDEILVEVSGSISKMEDKLYDMALAGDTTSKEFIELQEQTARYKQVVIEVDRSVDALAEQGRGLSTALTLSESAIAGYQAYQSATAILGVENEKLLETLTKIQAAEGLLNSIQTLRTKVQENAVKIQQAQTKAQTLYNFLVGKGTILQKAQIAIQAAAATGMKVLNAVMNANPIFLIITGITALIGAFAWFSSSTEDAEEKNEALNASIDRSTAAFERNQAAVAKNAENRRRLLVVGGATEEQLHQDTLKRLQEEQDARVKEFNMLEGNIAKRRVLYKDALDEENWELAKSIREQIESDRKRYHELFLQKDEFDIAVKEENKRFLDDLNKQQEDADKEAEKLRKQEQKKREDAWKKRIADAKATAERIRKLTLDNQKLSLDNQRKATEAHFDFLEEAAQGNADALIAIEKEKNQELDEIETRERQARIDRINSDIDKEIELRKKNAEEVAVLERNREEQIEAVNIEFDNRKKQRDQKSANREDELREQRVKDEIKAAGQIQLIDAEMNLARAKTDEERLEAFKKVQEERIRLIKAAAAEELKNAELTAEQKALIQKEAEQQILEINLEQFEATDEAAKKSAENRKELAIQLVNAAQQFANIMVQIAQNQLQAEINAETEKNEAAQAGLQSQLDAQIITQQEFETQKQELDNQFRLKERELKEKQFKRDKAAAIINATIATAVSVAQALPNVVLAGISGALGLAQIALIAAQPTPKFEKGAALSKEGTFSGPSHAGGGIQLSANGVPIAEVEGDEKFFVVNKRASKTIQGLSDLNQKYGGVPLARRGAVMKFQAGGDFAQAVSQPVDNQFDLTRQFVAAASAIPNPVVLVQDINDGQENLAEVVDSANF